MINWYEIAVEQEIAQERYEMLKAPARKPLKTGKPGQPWYLKLLARTGRQFQALGCTLLTFAGDPCS